MVLHYCEIYSLLSCMHTSVFAVVNCGCFFYIKVCKLEDGAQRSTKFQLTPALEYIPGQSHFQINIHSIMTVYFGRKSNNMDIWHFFRVFLSGHIVIFLWYLVFIYVICKLFWVIIGKFQVIIFHFFGQNRFAIFAQKMKNITWNYPISPKKFTYHIKKTKYHKKSRYDH